MDQITIQLNGQPKSIVSRDIAQLLTELGLQDKKLAVELNRHIIARDKFAATVLNAGDAVEIVHFVGGG